jgi:hypothetical protein
VDGEREERVVVATEGCGFLLRAIRRVKLVASEQPSQFINLKIARNVEERDCGKIDFIWITLISFQSTNRASGYSQICTGTRVFNLWVSPIKPYNSKHRLPSFFQSISFVLWLSWYPDTSQSLAVV